MVVTGITSLGLPILLAVRKEAHDIIGEINKRCEEVGTPPAFRIGSFEEADSLEQVYLHNDLDFRFEGFGLDFSHIKPRLSFWVHYKPESPDHVEVGRFCVPLRLMENVIFTSLGVGKMKKIIDSVGSVTS